jgi:hypothetical protein
VSRIRASSFPNLHNCEPQQSCLHKDGLREALAQLDVALRYYEGFRDAPEAGGSTSLSLKITALLNLGREKDAEPLVDQIARMAGDPETVRAARVQVAASMARRGEHARRWNSAKAF